MMRRTFIWALLALTTACSSNTVIAPSSDRLVLKPVSYREIYGWNEDNQADALGAFVKSCGAFDRMQDNDATGQGDMLAPAVVWREVCRKAESTPPNENATARRFFEEYFIPARATNDGNPAGLITGYYEPVLKGSRIQQRPYVYPVYGVPVAGTPAYTRSQIDLGALNGHAPIVAYVDDPVRLFFLHIQGSGRILLPDNTMLHLSYAGSNGLPYVPIGKVLADQGSLNREQVTMPVLRQWLYDHPGDMWKIMWENTSYIYFRETQGDPVGTQQVPLTPGRSLAIDMRFIPLGAPIFLDTVLPETPDSPMTIHRKLLVAQDSGAAIKGPTRADIFFGFGTSAEQVAGRMKAGGAMTILLPRPLARTVLGTP